MFKHPLGARARDLVSNVEGIIVTRCEHLNGCNRYVIEQPLNKDGKIPELISFDEERIMVLPGPDFQGMAQKAASAPVSERGGPREIVARDL